MNRTADKYKLISDKEVQVIDEDYFLVQLDSKTYNLYKGKTKCAGAYNFCTKYKDIVVLQRADVGLGNGKYTVITSKGLTDKLDNIGVMGILMKEIDFSKLVVEELQYKSEYYSVDDIIINKTSKNNLITICVRGDFVTIGISINHFDDFSMIFNKDGKKVADFTQGINRNVELAGDNLIVEIDEWSHSHEDLSRLEVFSNNNDNNINLSDKRVMFDKEGNILKRFEARHLKVLDDVIIVQGNKIIDIESLESMHEELIEREFARNKNNVSIRTIANKVGIICEKSALSKIKVKECSVINFVTQEVYENVTAYNFNQRYSAVIVDLEDRIKIINTYTGETISIKCKLDELYKDNNKVTIMRLTDGTRYKLGAGCTVGLY